MAVDVHSMPNKPKRAGPPEDKKQNKQQVNTQVLMLA
jgi:hypothetical protein